MTNVFAFPSRIEQELQEAFDASNAVTSAAELYANGEEDLRRTLNSFRAEIEEALDEENNSDPADWRGSSSQYLVGLLKGETAALEGALDGRDGVDIVRDHAIQLATIALQIAKVYGEL